MKKYKHKLTGDIAGYNGSRYVVAELGSLYVPDRYIENSNDWELIPSIEVGNVYKGMNNNFMILVKRIMNDKFVDALGFDVDGKWHELSVFGTEIDLVEATKEEWFERCKEEAIKRGLVKGVKFKSPYSGSLGCVLNYFCDESSLLTSGGYLMDSDTGKWATVIEEKKPILTTHDGVELFDGDKYWYVTSNFYGKRRKLREGDVLNPNFVRFSTKEKA